MASPFDEAADMAFADMTEFAGEPVTISPRIVTPRRGQAPDTNREPKTVTGIFTLVSDEVPLEGSRRGADGRGTTTFAVGDAKVWLSRESVVALGFTPRKGDAVILPDRNADERWAIVRPDPSDLGDITLHIVRERDAAELG